jgi:hypothetical protein
VIDEQFYKILQRMLWGAGKNGGLLENVHIGNGHI